MTTTTMVGELKPGDHFIDFENGGGEFVVGWVGRSPNIEAYRVDDRDAESVIYFGHEDMVEVMA